MKKKNGFIATSLIYTFFLAFITLFLVIIADYLQQKVLLNSIEKGIKEEINNQMTFDELKEFTYIYELSNCKDKTSASLNKNDESIQNRLKESIIQKCSIEDVEDSKCKSTNSICIVVKNR